MICRFLADVLHFPTTRVVVPLSSVDWKRCTILLGTNLGLSFVPVGINRFSPTWWIHILILIHYISEAYPKCFITCKNMICKLFEIFENRVTIRLRILKKLKYLFNEYAIAFLFLKKGGEKTKIISYGVSDFEETTTFLLLHLLFQSKLTPFWNKYPKTKNI